MNVTLNALLAVLTQLSAGKLDVEVDLQTAFAGMDQADVQTMISVLNKLQSRLKSLSGTINGIAQGNIPLPAPLSAEDQLDTNLQKMLGHLRCTIAQVDAGSQSLGAAESQLASTSNDASNAIQEIVTAFGNVTSHTFSQFSAINRINSALQQLDELALSLPEDVKQPLTDIKQNISEISLATEENAKITVGLRLTTNKILEQIDQVVATSQGLKGMTLGLQGTLAPYIIRSRDEQDSLLKIAYLPIADHLVLPLTYLHQLEQPDGLPLHPLRCSAWPQLVKHLENDADGALILAPLAIKAYLDELPAKVVMAVHRNGSGLVLEKNLESIDDLPGRVVAVPHRYSTHNVLLYKALEKAGIPYDAVEVKWAPPPLMPYFLQRGTLDGFVSAEPFPEVALDIGAGKMAFYSKDIMPNHMCCVLLMKEECLVRSAEQIIRLVQSFIKTGKNIGANPAKAAQDVAPFFGVAPSIMQRVLTSPPDRITYDDLSLNKVEFTVFGEAMIDMGLIPEPFDVDDLVDTSYYEAAVGAG